MTKRKKKTLKYLSISLGVLAVSVAAILIIPSLVGFTEGKVLVSAGVSTNKLNLGQGGLADGQVAGVESKPSIKIESLGMSVPSFSALSVLAEDLQTGQILYQKDIHKRLLPASTTKLMTALVALNQFKLSDILTVAPEDLVGGSEMGLSIGEKISFRSLLYGMLLNSGNDAAFTIASNFPGGIESFVKAMNDRSGLLGLLDTHFQNPAGFDDPAQYSSAYDLGKIALFVSQNEQLIKITSTKETIVYSLESGKEHLLKNLNKLLDEPGVEGIKTGKTAEAGENLVGLVQRNGHRVLTVVLSSTDRFGETKTLMDWVYKNYTWKIE